MCASKPPKKKGKKKVKKPETTEIEFYETIDNG